MTARLAAWRDEADPCQKGTDGCCIDHQADESCEPW